MKVKYTSRNFEIIEFRDYNNQECSLQQSSLALYVQPGSAAIWFGVGEERMHLSEKELKKLLPHLQQWLKEGTFVIPKSTKKTNNMKTKLDFNWIATIICIFNILLTMVCENLYETNIEYLITKWSWIIIGNLYFAFAINKNKQ